VHDAYGSRKLHRLVAVKGQYDPENLFHLDKNI
jgi:Berberine and berberine like